MTTEPIYKEQTIPIKTILIGEDQNDQKWLAVNDMLNEMFNLNKNQEFTEDSHKNVYFYLDPETQEFESGRFDSDRSVRKQVEEDYLGLLKRSFQGQTGSINVSEEIYGIITDQDHLRTKMSNNEHMFKFLNRVSINQPLDLYVLQIDKLIPQIVNLKITID